MISETVRSDPSRLATFEPADSFHQRVTDPVAAHDSEDSQYSRMLALAPSELERALRRQIETEHDLPDAMRHPAVLARLRAWLALDGEDARVIARAFEAALATFPGEYAARRRETESAVMLNGMSFAEFRALSELLPWLGADTALDVFAAALGDADPAPATAKPSFVFDLRPHAGAAA